MLKLNITEKLISFNDDGAQSDQEDGAPSKDFCSLAEMTLKRRKSLYRDDNDTKSNSQAFDGYQSPSKLRSKRQSFMLSLITVNELNANLEDKDVFDGHSHTKETNDCSSENDNSTHSAGNSSLFTLPESHATKAASQEDDHQFEVQHEERLLTKEERESFFAPLPQPTL